MPLYEYRCRACGHTFETLRGINDKDEDVKCPACGKKQAEKLLSTCCTIKGESSATSAGTCGTGGFT